MESYSEMTRIDALSYLIRTLRQEMPEYRDYAVPADEKEAFRLFRALCNVRMPAPASEKFLAVQDHLLQSMTEEKGIADAQSLTPSEADPRLTLWQGDITALRCDAIVNAANSQMLGCFRPLHGCIDNIIHTMAGVQLRSECNRQMTLLREKYGAGYEQPTSVPMITPGYNLPAKYVIHVVGPIVAGPLRKKHEKQLADCYANSLELAGQYGCASIAFCCISTGVFMFPQDRAAEIAVQTTRHWLDEHPDAAVKKVIFDVFKDSDRALYEKQLSGPESEQ